MGFAGGRLEPALGQVIWEGVPLLGTRLPSWRSGMAGGDLKDHLFQARAGLRVGLQWRAGGGMGGPRLLWPLAEGQRPWGYAQAAVGKWS